MRCAVRRGRRVRAATTAAVLALGLIATGCSAAPAEPVGSAGQSISTREPDAVERSAEVSSLPPVKPVSVSIPRLNAHSSLVQVGLNSDGTMAVPPVTQPKQAAWYKHSPTPGEVGPTILLGHVDGGGEPGIFHQLRTLDKGDEVLVKRQDGSMARFVIERVQQVAKNEFPTGAVYGNTSRAEIRLITCGGVFDKGSGNYRDNIIAYGVLADARP